MVLLTANVVTHLLEQSQGSLPLQCLAQGGREQQGMLEPVQMQAEFRNLSSARISLLREKKKKSIEICRDPQLLSLHDNGGSTGQNPRLPTKEPPRSQCWSGGKQGQVCEFSMKLNFYIFNRL